MRKIPDSAVSDVFASFPASKRQKLLELRELIYEVVDQSDDIGGIEETLKWGEPAYLCKKGSTLRLGWQKKHSDYCGLYFNCQTTLVETIKEIYSDQLNYEGKRAVLFLDSEQIPEDIAKHCIELSLRYHKIKHLPLLGA